MSTANNINIVAGVSPIDWADELSGLIKRKPWQQ